MKLGVLQNSHRVVYIDDSDYLLYSQHKWYLHTTGCVFSPYGVKLQGKWITKNVRLHRLLLNAPKDKEVDHINGNKLDNQRSNLRLCNHLENSWNRPAPINKSSGYRGVTWHKTNKLWRSRIKVDTREVLLGYYKSAFDAHSAYESARMYLHGDFLWTP